MNTPAFTPVRKRLLTRPVLKFVKDEPRHVLIETPIILGREMKQRAGEEKKKEPAHVCDAIDLTTGELVQLIMNAVPLSVLNEEYPAEAYVGKAFTITRQGRKEGKQYDPFSVEEIEVPKNFVGHADAAAQKAATDRSVKKAANDKASEAPADLHGKGGKK